MLPSMPNADGIKKYAQVKFGGYEHTASCSEGGIYDMQNLTADYLPVIGTRPPRRKLRRAASPHGIIGGDELYYAAGTSLYKSDGTNLGTLADSDKAMAIIGGKLIIMPDKKYLENGTLHEMESSYTGTLTFKDGIYAGEDAELNTIYSNTVLWSAYFRVGDAVKISGCTNAGNNKTAIIREIDGNNLRFYENSFTAETTNGVTVKREVPDMDYICECNNRLWGCKGDTIYASKLGDALNFNVYDGVATDSWACDVGSAGDFTACISFLGYPVFFKEDMIHKVYGSYPKQYQTMDTPALGVASGSSRSMGICGNTMYYLSRAGVVAYSGGIPTSVNAAFGDVRYSNGAGGSDGVKYYLSMSDGENSSLFVNSFGVWMREDGSGAFGFAQYGGELYMYAANGNLWLMGNVKSTPTGSTAEGEISSVCEFGDFYEGSPNKKGVSKYHLRLEVTGTLTVSVSYDGGAWSAIKSVTAQDKRSVYIPIIPRRCDRFRLRLSCEGSFKLYSLAREVYAGSAI